MPLPVENRPTTGHLKNVMRRSFVHCRQRLDQLQMQNTEVSVGARLQANNGNEVIITQTGHTIQKMKGGATVQKYTINFIAFSKSYTTAAYISDELVSHFSERTEDEIIQATENASQSAMVKASWEPISQTMYYTDEDDYAVNLAVECTVVDKIYLLFVQ